MPHHKHNVTVTSLRISLQPSIVPSILISVLNSTKAQKFLNISLVNCKFQVRFEFHLDIYKAFQASVENVFWGQTSSTEIFLIVLQKMKFDSFASTLMILLVSIISYINL